jgi:hypothetical protein
MEHWLGSPGSKRSCLQGLCAAISITLLLFASGSRAETGPFAGLAGNWTGGGTISLGNGTKERIRCRASYSVSAGGNGLQQSLRCASDSYRFELSSNVTHQAGQLTGMWNEASRNIGGVLFGSVRAGQFEVIVSSPSFSANLSLTTHADHQSVVITAPPGGQLTGVSITLTRSK